VGILGCQFISSQYRITDAPKMSRVLAEVTFNEYYDIDYSKF